MSHLPQPDANSARWPVVQALVGVAIGLSGYALLLLAYWALVKYGVGDEYRTDYYTAMERAFSAFVCGFAVVLVAELVVGAYVSRAGRRRPLGIALMVTAALPPAAVCLSPLILAVT